MGQIRRYYGVAHIRWELPFPTRLAPRYMFCWEPGDGAALLLCLPRVGTVKWRRHSTIVDQKALLGGRFLSEPSEAMPGEHYFQSNNLSTGGALSTTKLLPGEFGGFDEAHAYTVANVFLCIRAKADFSDAVFERAASAINNVMAIHALIAADGWTRPIRPALDAYATIASLALVPDDWAQMTATETLKRVDELAFGTETGNGRISKVGVGSPDDLLQAEFDPSNMAIISTCSQQQFVLTPYQQLVLSAIRRVGRREYAAAIIDAQSAAEVCVGGMLRRALLSLGRTEEQVEADFDHLYGSLERRVTKLDHIAKAAGATALFGPSTAYKDWRNHLAAHRHAIVHRGVRDVSFEQARLGISAAMVAIAALEEMWPAYQPTIKWAGEYLQAAHLAENAGKLYRLFEA